MPLPSSLARALPLWHRAEVRRIRRLAGVFASAFPAWRSDCADREASTDFRSAGDTQRLVPMSQTVVPVSSDVRRKLAGYLARNSCTRPAIGWSLSGMAGDAAVRTEAVFVPEEKPITGAALTMCKQST